MAELLSPRQVEDEFGFGRTDLLQWERDGILTDIQRTQGGHRRYTRDAIENAVIVGSQVEDGEKIDPSIVAAMPYTEFGVTGLRKWGGSVQEERLSELRGRRGRIKKREMRLNDPVLGAMFFGIGRCLRQADWRVSPASESDADKKTAEFIESCIHDMSWDWDTQLALIIEEELEQGFAINEIVYKRRLGETPFGGSTDIATSLYDDGLVGWRKWSPRPAESLVEGNEWIFDRHGGIHGINQEVQYPDMKSKKPTTIPIPINKLLHNRTTPHPANNPEGMALTLDTKVPTPDGWTTMGEISVGDKVYGKDGKIRYVVWKSPVWENRPVYKITFRTGHSVIADENHLWSTTISGNMKTFYDPVVKTTKELDVKFNGKSKVSMCVGVVPILDGQKQDLLIDPYILGYWLGDGSSNGGSIAVSKDDYEFTSSEFNKAGYPASPYKNNSRYFTAKGLHSKLRITGLKWNKHIPRAYLIANKEQRLALLQGLMDSDGTVSRTEKDRANVYCTSSVQLLKDFCELVYSLGGRARVREVGYIGKECGTINGNTIIQRQKSYVVQFFLQFPAFRMDRKLCHQSIKDNRRVRGHFIKSIELYGHADTVCIEVDDPDHIFLITEGFVPTHNSVHRAAYVPWWFKVNIQELEGIGIERDLSGIPVIYLGKGTTTSGANSDYELAKELVVNLRNDEQAGIVLPRPKMNNNGEGILLELLSTGSRRQYDTTKIISRYDKAMAMSTLSQFLFLGTENTGSYALASWQGDLFALAIRSFQNGIAAVINRHAITKLVRLNDNAFAGRTGYPKLVPGTVGIPDLKTFSEFINTMVGAAVLTPDDELERHVRQTARLPQATISVSTEERIGRNNQNSMGNDDKSASEDGAKEDKPEE